MKKAYFILLALLILFSFGQYGWSVCDGDTDCDGDVDGADVANVAADLGAFSCGTCDDFWQLNGSDIYFNNGYIGIGKTDPASQLDVSSTNVDAITGKSFDGIGVVGISTGCSGMFCTGIGGWFESTNGLGTAMHAVNTGAGIGVYGEADSIASWAGYFEGRVHISYRLGINTSSPEFTLDVNGSTRTNALVIGNGSDIAEPFKVGDSINIMPGMVVSIDSEQPGQVRIADSAYDRTVAGIVSGANGLNTGLTMSQEGTMADGTLPVALTGRVYAWADASKGPIKPGDLLTTSDTPGHAMKVNDYEKGHGAVLGKSMTALKQGKGLVLVLVSLQ
jgi:hypothetical protein